MLLDVVADNRERQAKATQVSGEVTVRDIAPGVTSIAAQTDPQALAAFMEDEEGGNPLARLSEAFPDIFASDDELAARREASGTVPPDDMDPAQVAALLGQLGLADEA